MIYELRVFHDHPGRTGVHVDRFREHTGKLLEKQGFTVVGCWTTANDEHGDEVVWMVGHDSVEAMAKAQAAFNVDPVRLAMVAESEKDGPIIDHVDRWALQPTDFSPLQ